MTDYNLIDCTTENLLKKRKRKKKRFKVFLTLIFLSIIILYYRFVVSENLIKLCEDYAYSYSASSVNSAVVVSLSNESSFKELVKIEKNSAGDVVLMTADSFKANALSREITINTEEILGKKLEKGVPIPFMAFTGLELFSGFGKTVNIKTLNVSSTTCDFISEFKSSGINQTIHEIYVEIKCKINLDFPLNEKEIEFSNKVLVNQAVIIGKIPEVYLNGKLFGS